MDGVLLVINNLSEGSDQECMDILEEVSAQTESSVVEMVFVQEPMDISRAILRCVKQGVVHLIVIPCLFREESERIEFEQLVREEVAEYRGMSMDILLPDFKQADVDTEGFIADNEQQANDEVVLDSIEIETDKL